MCGITLYNTVQGIDFNFFIFYYTKDGWVAEWLNAPVLKTGEGVSLPGVRIPPHPPLCSESLN